MRNPIRLIGDMAFSSQLEETGPSLSFKRLCTSRHVDDLQSIASVAIGCMLAAAVFLGIAAAIIPERFHHEPRTTADVKTAKEKLPVPDLNKPPAQAEKPTETIVIFERLKDDIVPFAGAIAVLLATLSWAYQTDGFRLHRLIRIVAASEWSTNDDRRRAKAALVLAIADIYPSSDQIFHRHEMWPTARALNVHVAQLMINDEDGIWVKAAITRSVASLMSRYTSYAQRIGAEKDTIMALWQSNLILCQRNFGDRDDMTAEMHNNIGVYLDEIKSGHELALAHYERAYLLRHNMRGWDSRTALCAGNIAALLHVNGNLAIALVYSNIAIRIAEKSKPDTMFAASIMIKAAPLFADFGEIGKAEQLLDRAEVIVRRDRPLSIEMAELLKIQGTISAMTGDRERQLSAQQSSLKVLEAFLIPTNWLVLSARNNLCHAYIDNEQYEAALCLEKLPIRLKKQGHPCDRSVVYAYNAVSRICTQKGRLLWAERFLLHALYVINGLIAGPDDDKAQILYNLAHAYLAQRRPTEALRLLRRTLRMRRTCHGSVSEAVASTLADLGFTYDKLERTARATRLHRLAVFGFERCLGPNHQRTRDGRLFLWNRFLPNANFMVAGKMLSATTYRVTYVSAYAFPAQQSTS